jgi:hypothetical protein
MKKLLALVFVVFTVFISSAQSISTNRDIYNFDIGDIFHYEHEMQAPSSGANVTSNVEIAGKYYSIGQDTVFYIRDVILKTTGSGIPTQISSFTDTIFYSSLDSLVNSGIIDSVFYDTTLYNGRKINRDTNSYYDLYADSLGKVVDLIYYEPVTLTINEERLVYYRKGSEEWGNPVYVGIKDNFESLNVNIFPNPASTNINVVFSQFPKEPLIFELFDITGRLKRLYKFPKQKSVVLDINDLQKGVYILHIKSNKEISKSIKLIRN